MPRPGLPLLLASVLAGGGWRLGLGQCAVCRDWTRGTVCAPCWRCFAAPRPRCPRCALEVPRDGQTCGACLRLPPPQVFTLAGLPYAYPWDGLVQRLKRGDAVELAPWLVEPLSEALAQHLSQRAGALPDVLVPVPLAPGRLCERGHNQAWLLALALARRWSLPALPRAVERVVETPHQLALPREQRLRNVRGAFVLAPGAREQLQGRRVAVVDDVMTTGATVAELVRTLQRAGAAEVQAWVVARTPLE